MKRRRNLVAGVVVLFAAMGVLAAKLMFGSVSYDGPSSPDGKKVRIEVSDRQPTPGADFYCDIRVYDSTDSLLASWDDPKGQRSRTRASAFVESLRWNDEGTLLVGQSAAGRVEIAVKRK